LLPGIAHSFAAAGRTYTHSVPEAASKAQEICVKVRLFASYREAAKTNRLDLALAAGARVSDLIDLLAERLPALRAAPGMVAVNHTYVGPDFTLHDGDEAAFIPPVSGGNS
jgi:MoaE-MoaD fusion protein